MYSRDEVCIVVIRFSFVTTRLGLYRRDNV